MPAKEITKYLGSSRDIDMYEYFDIESFTEALLSEFERFNNVQGKIIFSFNHGEDYQEICFYERRMETEEESKQREEHEAAVAKRNRNWKMKQLEALKKELGVQ